MLRLNNIKKDYKIAAGTVHALKGVSLAFRRNEFVSVLGQSGCGKTTLLNIIGGLDHYTQGDLIIQGKSTKDFSDHDWDVYRNHRIGFIFQSYNLIPHQSVLGNVELALTIAGVSKDERRERAKQALIRVGLGEEEWNKRPNQLSGGQMQRVSIARALINNPDILLADEPTGALDSVTSVQIMELIREIAGERLVIMVTHNPDLAEKYSSRIVRLKDGLVESDSNPYSFEEEIADQKQFEEEQARNEPEGKKPRKGQPRARMSFTTSLALSGRNLLSKKGRTVLTSAAGSIGIISVCLVLALSSGFNNYIEKSEEDMLSYYPVEITESTYDLTSIMAGFTSSSETPDMSEIGDKVYVDSFLTNMAKGMTVQNNITETYITYLESMDESLYNAIQYSYGVTLTDNLFTDVITGTKNEEKTTRYMSLTELKTFYTQELVTNGDSQYAQLAYMIDYLGSVVGKMPGTSDVSDDSFGDYVLSQYDVVAGSFPTNSSEVVLVIGEDNDMTDLTLAQLGYISEEDFLSLFDEDADGDDYLTIDFSDILNSEFVLYYNDGVYTKNDSSSTYTFTYNGEKQSLDIENGNGVKLTVSGILRLKEGMTYGCLSSGINLTEQLVNEYIAKNMQSEIVTWINTDGTVESGNYTYCIPPAEHLLDYYTSYTLPTGTTVYFSSDENESVIRYLGGNDFPSAISLYLVDFDTKEDVIDYLDAWNTMCDNGETYNGVTLSSSDQITYTDTVGTLMVMMQTMLNVITYVLVAFTAISLVVSSVMIGIITYVSVVERVKEIGVLRSLGARKKDIRNLFNAETFIIGLAAGLIGIGVAYLLEIPINAIIYSLSGISSIAALPVLTAFIMVAISVVLTLISGLIPASKAAKKDPVIALRTE